MELDFKSLQPSEYLCKFLEHKLRPDGRTVDTARQITVNSGSISTADGSALVRMGGTLVMCGVKTELSNPPPDKPNIGYLVCNVELPPLCSSDISPGPPSTVAQVLSQTLQDTLLRSGCIDLEKLCITNEMLCWVLHVDVVCLSDNGNIQDACILAASAALNNTQLPAVDSSGDTPQVSFQHKTPLFFNPIPLSITHALFNNHVLLDPTKEEETLCTGRVSIIVLGNGSLAGVEKTGKPALSPEKLLQLCKQAQGRAKLLCKLVQTTGKS